MAHKVSNVSFDITEDAGGLVLSHAQDIPQSWADWLAVKRREAWDLRRNTEHIHVASIPAIFVTKWMAEGFNVYAEPVKAIVRKIRVENLEGFLATEKSAV